MIHFALNAGTVTQAGVGIPMATDIAFSLGARRRCSAIDSRLKVFLVAFAVMDDLFAIIIIAIFYTAKFSIFYLAGAMAVWVLLIVLNHYFKVMLLVPYRNRRGVDVVFDVEVGCSRDNCRRVAGVCDAVQPAR